MRIAKTLCNVQHKLIHKGPKGQHCRAAELQRRPVAEAIALDVAGLLGALARLRAALVGAAGVVVGRAEPALARPQVRRGAVRQGDERHANALRGDSEGVAVPVAVAAADFFRIRCVAVEVVGLARPGAADGGRRVVDPPAAAAAETAAYNILATIQQFVTDKGL